MTIGMSEDVIGRTRFFITQRLFSHAVCCNYKQRFNEYEKEKQSKYCSLNFRYSSIHISTGFNVLHTRLNWHNKNRNTADIYLWVIVLCTSFKYAYLYCTVYSVHSVYVQYIRIHTGYGYVRTNAQRLHYTKSPMVTLHKIPNGYITQNPQRLHFTKSPTVTLHKIPNGEWLHWNTKFALNFNPNLYIPNFPWLV